MKIIGISDTHLVAQDKLTEKLMSLYNTGEDFILIHAGDALNRGTYREACMFLDWYHSLPFKHKLYIPGNHDFCFDTQIKDDPMYLKLRPDQVAQEWPSIKLLINDVIDIDGISIGGVCAIPDLPGWAFYMNNMDRRRLFSLLPKVDVLVNHAPFAPFLEAKHYSYSGCDYAKQYAVDNKIKVYICGHIHENYGYKNVDSVDCYNVAILNEHYKGCNEPTVIDVYWKDKL